MHPNCLNVNVDLVWRVKIVTRQLEVSQKPLKYVQKMTSKTKLLERKYYTYQCRQFVTAPVICSDKTLISLNILNSNEHAHAAQPTREGERVGYTA